VIAMVAGANFLSVAKMQLVSANLIWTDQFPRLVEVSREHRNALQVGMLGLL